MVMLKSPPGRRARARDQDMEQEGDENGFLGEQNYIQALGADNMEGEWNIVLLVLFCCHQIVMTDLPHDLTLQKMMMGCPEWLDPPYSPSRKSNVDTAWLRLVRDVHIHLVWTNASFQIHHFCVFHSQRASWLGLLQKRWPSAQALILTRPLPHERAAVSWVHSLFGFCLVHTETYQDVHCVSSNRPEEWKPDATESECKNVPPHVFDERALESVLSVWQGKKVQFVSTTPHRLRKRITSEFRVVRWKQTLSVAILKYALLDLTCGLNLFATGSAEPPVRQW